MRNRHDLTRRDFLSVAAAGATATSIAGISIDRAAREGAPSVAIEKSCWLADKFVEWQNPYGRFDRERVPAAIGDGKFFVLCYIASAMYRAFEATGNLAYKVAADRYWVFYLAAVGNRYPELGGRFTSARAGIGLIPFKDFRHCNPDEPKLNDAANSLYARLLEYRWNEGSYFRNGYISKNSQGMDAANSDDNAAIGCGLMSYYAVSGKPDVLTHAEGLAEYFLTECAPMTYRGVWSTPIGTWIIAPTDNTNYEHSLGIPAFGVSFACSSIEAILYLTQLWAATNRDDLKQGIRQKCATSMQWQFDACQFDDGACGLSGRDDKWMGMTAGAILSYLRVRDAGFLSEDQVAAYRPKALGARDWILGHLDDDCLERGGYWKFSGRSKPHPKCNLAWFLGWTVEALTQVDRI